MKRRINENIEIGDEVYVTRDEYKGTVIDINGDEVLIDGLFGKEYFDINDLEKLGGDYEEEDLAPSFRKNFMESRKKVIRLTESDLARIVRRVIKENMDDLGLPHPRKTVYKERFEQKLNDVISEVGSDSESIYMSLISALDRILEDYNYDKMDGGRHTWEDDTDNMVNETSLMNRFQYYKEIRDAKKQAKETNECMCVVETRVSGVIVKPCSELTSTEEDHIIYNTDNCDTFDGTY